ncbi:E3 ubiquitin-protein ligase RNF38-like protein [Lates japonicus]|uniref:E3 ubiquitin-protein ligase RNF38-like protein n=1 Tax=Lates japonicus TaxID=270547 RepID=A0AAD3NKK9_LATJO|nr:E3 ubiquitin-protein ligase RNF38-like protein [Lates japonicus]
MDYTKENEEEDDSGAFFEGSLGSDVRRTLQRTATRSGFQYCLGGAGEGGGTLNSPSRWMILGGRSKRRLKHPSSTWDMNSSEDDSGDRLEVPQTHGQFTPLKHRDTAHCNCSERGHYGYQECEEDGQWDFSFTALCFATMTVLISSSVVPGLRQNQAMDPPRTRSRSRSCFYHFGMNGSVGSNGSGNAVGNGSLMNASGGGVSYPQQSNPGWAPHHGGRSYPESQQQHTQGSYLSAGAQRHSSHGAHRHPGAGGVLHFHPDNVCSEDRDKMEDSPSPKRQRLSQQSMLDLSSAPPSTPSSPIRPWELPPSRRPHPHYMPERCHTPVRNRRR